MRTAITWAIGLAILLNSRPYDGAVLAVLIGRGHRVEGARPLGSGNAARRARGSRPHSGRSRSCSISTCALRAIPSSCPTSFTSANMRVANNFAWSSDKPVPVYDHAVMRTFWTKLNADQVKDMQPASCVRVSDQARQHVRFFLLLLSALPSGADLALSAPDASGTHGRSAAGGRPCSRSFPSIGFQYHYAAAIMPLVYLRFLQSVDRLRTGVPGSKPIGGWRSRFCSSR